jgi:hypothetical protein
VLEKDISTSSSGEGRSIRSDSNHPPFETPPGPHGTGGWLVPSGTTRDIQNISLGQTDALS